MKVIILAAGIGHRLGELANGQPKCLLKFNGVSLLQRHLLILQKHKINEIIIVTGHRQNDILEELKRLNTDTPVKTIYNPDFSHGSVVSLWCAREFLLSGEDIVLMDADVLYDPQIMQTLINSPAQDCFLLDKKFEPGEEPVKLCVRDGILIDFRKKIDKDLHFDYQGESVGFFKFSPVISTKLVNLLQRYIDDKRIDEPYEEVIRELLLDEPETFAFEDISEYPWLEIDFPEDIERAQQILTKIESVEQ